VIRRRLALAALAWPVAAPAALQRAPLVFPRDHGAHLQTQTEWWYATGWLGPSDAPTHGFQLTFFRSRLAAGAASRGRFAPRQLLFAHAALTDLGARRHRHAQRIARWSGDGADGPAFAAVDDGHVRIGAWSLKRQASGWHAVLPADGFALDLRLGATQPLLPQGDAGWSRKGPQPTQASLYYSEPQLAVSGHVADGERRLPAAGRGWLDREWSDDYLASEAVGWDWLGINLADGGALMAYRIRRPDGSAYWAGGSWRDAAGRLRVFGADEVVFTPGRRWRSAATQADYPVEWQLQTPAGRHTLRALLDTQELDSRGGTGAVYWEGLASLDDAGGRRVGLGYLEMTGYSGRLRMR
jgi:predicted secreted hydrolase